MLDIRHTRDGLLAAYSLDDQQGIFEYVIDYLNTGEKEITRSEVVASEELLKELLEIDEFKLEKGTKLEVVPSEFFKIKENNEEIKQYNLYLFPATDRFDRECGIIALELHSDRGITHWLFYYTFKEEIESIIDSISL